MNKRPTIPSNKKLLFIGYGILALVIGIIIVVFLNSQDIVSSANYRTVPWRHIHGLGIEPTDRTILYIATHVNFEWWSTIMAMIKVTMCSYVQYSTIRR